jgi:hypothetical protein
MSVTITNGLTTGQVEHGTWKLIEQHQQGPQPGKPLIMEFNLQQKDPAHWTRQVAYVDGLKWKKLDP